MAVKKTIRTVCVALAAVALALMMLAGNGTRALAESSVRPPGHAGNFIAEEPGPPNSLGDRSRSDMWRDIRHGLAGRPGASDAEGQLIRSYGEDWREFRRQYLLPVAPWLLLAVVAAIALFYIVRGTIRLSEGRSGKMVPRFSLADRISHWFLAATFILMGVSGLFILLGRPLLLPLIGSAAHSALLSASLQGHNLFGPIFIVALVILIVRFMRGNFLQWVDFQWMLKLGGLLGGHASSHKFNFGEKTWYWILAVVGLAMAATGVLLLFPQLAQGQVWLLQLATAIHAIGALILICIALGHIYIGTIGMEGSIDSMLRGEVDENWAKEHHDLWYEEVTGKSAGGGKPDGEAPGNLAGEESG